MQLTGAQQGKLQQAILRTFTNLEFQSFLLARLEEKLEVITNVIAMAFRFQVFDVIIYFNNNGTAANLINCLISEKPNELSFQELAFDLQISIRPYDTIITQKLSRQGLESLVNGDPSFPVNDIIQGIALNKRRVCRIRVEKEDGRFSYGTGFLLGKDLVLSNYHVFEPVIKNSGLRAKVVCKFDYEEDASSKQIYPGVDVGLHSAQPIIAYSPYCDYDTNGTPTVNVEWPSDALDYCLAKLDTPLGEMPFGPNADKASSEERGWITMNTQPAQLFNGSHMFIIQHPDKQPMKVAIGLSKVLGCDAKEMRVRYNINTMEGSSGSPCFDHKFNWIALHNMGDPNWNPQYNQGIPARRIVEDLRQKGVLN